MKIYVYVHNILQGDLPTRASGRERSGQSSVHFGEIGSIAGLSSFDSDNNSASCGGQNRPFWCLKFAHVQALGRVRFRAADSGQFRQVLNGQMSELCQTLLELDRGA